MLTITSPMQFKSNLMLPVGRTC